MKKDAKAALNNFKMQAANEVGVTLKQGYNGDITAREAGSVGGQMVKKIRPIRTLTFERQSRVSQGHKTVHKYQFYLMTQDL